VSRAPVTPLEGAGLATAMLAPLAAQLALAFFAPTTSPLIFTTGLLCWSAATTVLAAGLARSGGVRWADVGLSRVRITDLALGLATGLVLFLSYPVIATLLRSFGLSGVEAGLGRIGDMPLWLRLALPITAAISEEFAFRGFAIHTLSKLTGSRLMAAVLSWLMWTALHLHGWGLGGAAAIGLLGIAFTGLFIWKGRLWTSIAAHASNDGLAFVLAPMLLGHVHGVG